MDDEPDHLPALLGLAALGLAAAAWAPIFGFVLALGVGVSDADGFGCTLDDNGTPAALGAMAAAALFSGIASLVALLALVRSLKQPTAGSIAAALLGLSTALGALLASPWVGLSWAVFNDGLCWSKHIVIGRPLRVRSAPRTAPLVARADWATGPRPGPAPDDATRRALAHGWSEVGRGEHAAVAAFARLVLDLCAHGAPPDLIRRSLLAALDEVRHAERAFAVASAYRSAPVGPGPLAGDAPTPLATLAEETFVDGVVGEAVSAEVLGALARRADDPALAAVLAEAALDEAVHAELARDVVAWAARDPAVRRRLDALPPPEAPAVHALVPGVDASEVARRATARALVV